MRHLNKLHAIYPNIGKLSHCKNTSWHDAVVTKQIQISHTRITHLHLLTGKEMFSFF